MTPQEKRAKVEAAWERVECHASYNGRYSTHIAIKVRDRRSKFKDFYTLAYWWGNDFVEEKAWAVIIHRAFLFTEAHEQKIAEVKEEIAWVQEWSEIPEKMQKLYEENRWEFSPEFLRCKGVQRRILVREQAALADLMRGWKGGE
jgi:hypothetical protein